MTEAPPPENERERLAALDSYCVLDTAPEQAFDDLTRIAAQLFGTPISLVSLIDHKRQWFKSRRGLSACETPRGLAFCSHAILDPENVFVVPDATIDPRFADNPLVTGDPHVRFYAGAPLVTPEGLPIGTLCVIDHEPRVVDSEQIESLRALGRQVVSQLELRRTCSELSTMVGKVQRSNQELRDFTYIAAHDLQEPLRKLVSFSGLLANDLGRDLPKRAAEDLAFITDAARRMQKLINDLLELSRTGTFELHCAEIDLGDAVHRALETMSLRIEETGAQVVVDELPVVWGDLTLLTQLFQNLISNALKFTGGRAPRLHITCRNEVGERIVGVEDNGIGIEQKYAKQIFSPFKRLHGRSEYEGTGIGLAITRKAIERHGGRIWVESTLGEGSHFRFTFPALSEARRLGDPSVSCSGDMKDRAA